MREPYHFDRSAGDYPVQDTDSLATFGLDTLEPDYGVTFTTHNRRMILTSNTLRLHFKKI